MTLVSSFFLEYTRVYKTSFIVTMHLLSSCKFLCHFVYLPQRVGVSHNSEISTFPRSIISVNQKTHTYNMAEAAPSGTRGGFGRGRGGGDRGRGRRGPRRGGRKDEEKEWWVHVLASR